MEIRAASEVDIPAIVSLLKKSLGENLMPKSDGYWRWKHIANPFGHSPVFLCWEREQLIGVRAFMFWEWIRGGEVYRALRAVDTATHPDYQGRGIFKKLTLGLLDFCKQEGHHFVFNTPNKQSKPGYIKMGWQEAGILPIRVSIQRPLSMIKKVLSKSSDGYHTNDADSITYFLNHPGLVTLLKKNESSSHLMTNVSPEYLRWRYLNVPVARYFAVGDEQQRELKSLIIGRIKETRIGIELRITDFFCMENYSENKIVEQIKKKRMLWNVDFTTISGTFRPQQQKILGSLSVKASLGPMVTVRHVSLSDLSTLQKFKQWSPSLGDLELF